eukprot:TRINITY_DN5009_c1_g1_i1.p1 TRINITY_DN5009_c1_g1~~TRINITY_DN5009_c1_g1_i1.p1  ORF type:complete len:377 (+),score=94.23 TRINITY_DN5009_c1_g1_i1:550-1680(+)
MLKKKQEKEERKKRKKKDASTDNTTDDPPEPKKTSTKRSRRLTKADPPRASKKQKKDKALSDSPTEPHNTEDNEAEGEEDPFSPEPEPKEEGEDVFGSALARLRKGHNRRKPVDMQVVRGSVDEFIGRMIEAAEADVDANRQGKPALAKQQLLGETVQMLQRVHYHDALLDNGVLTAVKKWLDPMPDSSLPALNVRRDLLTVLAKLPVDKRHLQDSGIGRAVVNLARAPTETPTNKRLANHLITEWSRPIFELSTNYRDVATYDSSPTPSYSPKRAAPKPRDTASPMTDLTLLTTNAKIAQNKGKAASYHARIPARAALDYTRQPTAPTVEELKAQARSMPSAQRNINKKFASFKARSKKTPSRPAAARLSVNGKV